NPIYVDVLWTKSSFVIAIPSYLGIRTFKHQFAPAIKDHHLVLGHILDEWKKHLVVLHISATRPQCIRDKRVRHEQLTMLDSRHAGYEGCSICTTITATRDECHCECSLGRVFMLWFGVSRCIPITEVPQVLRCVPAPVVRVENFAGNIQRSRGIHRELSHGILHYMNDALLRH